MYEKNPIFNKNTHLCIHITWKHKHTCEHKHWYKHACIHTPNKLQIPQKYLRTVTIFLPGISYLRVIQFLHRWLPFPIYHQNRIQSTWMFHLLLLEFLSFLLDNQKWESHRTPSFTCLYLFMSQVLSSLLSEEVWRERVCVSSTVFLLPLTPESVPDKILTQLLTPAVRIIVLKFNTDSLWSCFSLAPDAENYCQFTVNSERNAQPTHIREPATAFWNIYNI